MVLHPRFVPGRLTRSRFSVRGRPIHKYIHWKQGTLNGMGIYIIFPFLSTSEKKSTAMQYFFKNIMRPALTTVHGAGSSDYPLFNLTEDSTPFESNRLPL